MLFVGFLRFAEFRRLDVRMFVDDFWLALCGITPTSGLDWIREFVILQSLDILAEIKWTFAFHRSQ